MIIPVFQPQGTSSHQLAKKLSLQTKEPVTHTGTLDPMADGVLICLTGEDRFNKSKYSSWQKIYEFSILTGIATDSHDLLGLVTKSSTKDVVETKIKDAFNQLVGSYEQEIPSFSAKRIDGVSYFDKAKKNQPIPISKQKITINSIHKSGERFINSSELISTIENKITRVRGDFRQEQILSNWKNVLTNNNSNPDKFRITYFTMVASKRSYVRGVVRDASKISGIPLTTFHIRRIQNGIYQIKNCICLL